MLCRITSSPGRCGKRPALAKAQRHGKFLVGLENTKLWKNPENVAWDSYFLKYFSCHTEEFSFILPEKGRDLIFLINYFI
jgi:hypothetical protein